MTDPLEFMKAPLLLIRGLPGSGKTTAALALLHCGQYDMHLEADMYHMKLGEYVYDTAKASAAHRWCLETTRVMLHIGKRVVVSNTFVTLEDMQPYRDLGFVTAFHEAKGAWPSTHNVPEVIMDHMRKRWQELSL